jgi:hypothetical protein
MTATYGHASVMSELAQRPTHKEENPIPLLIPFLFRFSVSTDSWHRIENLNVFA